MILISLVPGNIPVFTVLMIHHVTGGLSEKIISISRTLTSCMFITARAQLGLINLIYCSAV